MDKHIHPITRPPATSHTHSITIPTMDLWGDLAHSHSIFQKTYYAPAEAVQAGMKYLDERYPGWEHKINVSILDLNTTDCILWQLEPFYGALTKMEKELGTRITDWDALAHLGFSTTSNEGYILLTKTWKANILYRRSNPNVN